MGVNVMRYRDIRGLRSGRLTVIEPNGRNAENRIMWRCKCDCGGEVTVGANSLTRDSGTKSCGCLRKDAAQARLKKSGPWNEGKSYAIEGGKKVYKTRHSWAKALIRERGNRCEICGWDKARCDAHHRAKKSEGGLHTLENGIVLCPNCHRIAHEKGLEALCGS